MNDALNLSQSAFAAICRERDEARAALSGRTVSCSQCNESAKRADAMREAIKEAHKALVFLNDFHCSGESGTANAALTKLKPFLP